MKCQYCRAKLSEESLFCYRCGFNTYEAHLIAKRDMIKLGLACAALFLTLIAYLST
jgi:hypothetical protein